MLSNMFISLWLSKQEGGYGRDIEADKARVNCRCYLVSYFTKRELRGKKQYINFEDQWVTRSAYGCRCSDVAIMPNRFSLAETGSYKFV